MISVNALRATPRVQQVLRCTAVCLSLCYGSHATAAPAKPKPSAAEASNQSAARGLIERGRAELKAGRPEQALSSFQAARQLDDSLPAAEGIADATLALGKPAAARAGYSAALEQKRASLAPDALAAALAKLDALSAATAQLQLNVPIEGVRVQVDGVDVGQTPLAQPVILDPGPHELKLSKPGYVAIVQQFVFERGPRSETMTVVAEVAMGKLQVTAGAATGIVQLLIDNRPVGLLPWEGTLPAGKATLIARSNDATSRPQEVTVLKDVTTQVLLALEPNTGTVEISSAAAGVRISIDGRLVGVGNWRGSLPVGSHHLSLEREGFVTQEQEIQVQSNASTSEVVGHWVPVKSSAPAPVSKAADDRGLYFRLDLAGTFSNTSDGITQHCADAPSDAHCSSHAPLGGGLGLRAGYRFKWIAPELWGLGSLSVSYARAQYDTPSAPGFGSDFYGAARREDYVFFRYGWAAGVGVRATTPTNSVSATGGLGFGVFSQSSQYARTTTGSAMMSNGVVSVAVPAGQTATSSTAHSYAPGLLFDGGVLLGSSPGTKVYLGVLLAIEFAPEHAAVAAKEKTFADLPYGTPGIDIASGTQYRFGPVLGFQFGY